MPVLVIAGQARSVEAHHKTSVAKADLGNETLETVTIHAADTGSAQVLVKLPGRARADLPKSAGLIRNATWKRRWAIAHHLLVEKAQTRARMLYQWDQRTCTDARQIGRVRAGSNRRLGKIRRCDSNRPLPSVRQRDNDVGGTASRPLLQHLKRCPTRN